MLAVAVLAAATTANAQGTFEGIVDHSSPSPVYNLPTSGTLGWTFQATDWMEIRDLGCFNDLFLRYPELPYVQVGLWTSGGSLLASNVITAASTLFHDSRYESITPVGLVAGQTYHIGACSPELSIGIEVGGAGAGGSITMGTNLLLRATAKNDAGWGFPPDVGETGSAYLAPNFRAGVPEPSAALLLGLGALLFAVRRQSHCL
jgi:hypothetical protein